MVGHTNLHPVLKNLLPSLTIDGIHSKKIHAWFLGVYLYLWERLHCFRTTAFVSGHVLMDICTEILGVWIRISSVCSCAVGVWMRMFSVHTCMFMYILGGISVTDIHWSRKSGLYFGRMSLCLQRHLSIHPDTFDISQSVFA